MFIKHLVGSRAGEIEDVQFEGAKAKVLAGEAEDVYNQLGLPEKKAAAPVAAAPAVESKRAENLNLEANLKRKLKR
jgi:hypothetical protein